ncbi:S9 family peptidase [Metabacillus fastidiosus]|uniref:S9 family peptidase n=1 Tax=Metabacillus fastidiosus TaxID=1458 RepID=UPI000825BB44|nr:S9 family peptidase [Metabacillus fastidiosus]MED4454004.1 S9 family peptidase [Metabacillus fastidiosus]MED4460762.1 S9 family peptidase [Metabacillus fastidiosus]
MKKGFLSVVLASALAVSLPFSAMASEKHSVSYYESLVNKGVVPADAKLEAYVSAEEFINYALTELTYQHGSEYMREEIKNQWVRKGELEDQKALINRGEAARILIRALGVEKKEESLEDYVKTAEGLGILEKGYWAKQPVKLHDVVTIFENYKKAATKDIDNKGVKEISVEDFMKNPGDLAHQLSPDGNYISYASDWESRLNVFVQKMNGEGKPVRVTSSKDRDIAGFLWKDDQILYQKDNGGDENFHIYSSSFNGHEEKDLTPYAGVTVDILSTLQGVKDEILITMNKEDATVFDVYKLNIKTGKTTHVAKNPGNIAGWLADRDGKIRIALESDGVESTVLYRETEEEEFKPFIKTKAGETVSPITFSKDNKSIYALSNKDRDKIEFVKYDLTGKEEIIFSNPNVDVSGVLYDSEQDKLLFGAYITDKVHYKFFDEEFEKTFKHIQGKLKVSESEFWIDDFNKEKTKFIVSVSSDKVFGEYYYYDSTTDELTELANLSPWLDSENLADMHSISYKSRDGLTIHGYLTLPKNKKAENLPLIVNPHGGPWARDIWGFNQEVQLLANRGYAVLQVNFRSSTGYGKEFLDAGNKQWGLKIQDDITDGVQWAINQGIADPDRIGIYGASFGGYATLAGITFTPDLYKAAVDYVGVSNIFTLLDTVPPYWETMRNMFYERVGHPEKDKELLTAVSPVFHADKIKTPLFVAQGANDPRVNKAESDQIVEALRKRGVDVEYMVKDNEGHGFANEENRIEFYNAMIKFLDSHLK